METIEAIAISADVSASDTDLSVSGLLADTNVAAYKRIRQLGRRSDVVLRTWLAMIFCPFHRTGCMLHTMHTKLKAVLLAKRARHRANKTMKLSIAAGAEP